MENGTVSDNEYKDRIALEPTLSNDSEKQMLPPEDVDEEAEDDLDARDYQCGARDCRPAWLQPLANLKCFTGAVSLLLVFGSMQFTYYVAVLTQIEREFGLSSTMTGFIKNIDNIGYMVSVLLVTHFCRYANKPRLFCAANISQAVAIFLFAAPYFIYGASDPGSSRISRQNETMERPHVCTLEDESNDLLDLVDEDLTCHGRSSLLRPFNAGALAFFVLSELLGGVSSSPKYALTITYMDDNAKKQSPAYMGILFGMRAFSPVLGYALGAWTNSIYVDLSKPDISPKDPRWVGAWWLGFVICSLCTFVLAIPLLFFPAKFKEVEVTAAAKAQKLDITSQFKDLPRALYRLIKNPVYVFMICGSCCNFFLMGFSSFVPKYLENYYGLTAAKASMLTGVVSLLSFCLGPIISGFVTSKIKFGASGALKFCIVINILAAAGFAVAMFIKCPEKEFSGSLKSLDFATSCNANCTCKAYDFKPVCGDGINYFSPCHAGCTQEISNPNSRYKVYEGCACVGSMTANEGLCDKDCQGKFIAYLTVTAISKFCSSMVIVPYLTILMRISADKDKSVAVGLSSAISMVVSFPSPMLFGLAIDSTCLIHQSSCDRQGACLFYDSKKFRLAFHGLAVVVKLSACLAYCGALFFCLRQKTPLLNDVKDEDVKEKEETEEFLGEKIKTESIEN